MMRKKFDSGKESSAKEEVPFKRNFLDEKSKFFYEKRVRFWKRSREGSSFTKRNFDDKRRDCIKGSFF